MEKKQIIEKFLESLGDIRGKGFTLVCNSCGESDDYFTVLRRYPVSGSTIGYKAVFDYSSNEARSDLTGHLWDEVVIKCKSCGNAMDEHL